MRPGERRSELDATLRAAYAQGLLSEGTFVSRVGELLGGGSIQPERMVGDLTLRGRPSRGSRSAAALTRLVDSLRPGGGRAETLLALDWTGATETLLVGRGETCDILLDDLTVSRRHAQLAYRDGAWVLQDLESTNGTSLNGRPVGRAQLRPGDLVCFAEQRFRVD